MMRKNMPPALREILSIRSMEDTVPAKHDAEIRAARARLHEVERRIQPPSSLRRLQLAAQRAN